STRNQPAGYWCLFQSERASRPTSFQQSNFALPAGLGCFCGGGSYIKMFFPKSAGDSRRSLVELLFLRPAFVIMLLVKGAEWLNRRVYDSWRGIFHALVALPASIAAAIQVADWMKAAGHTWLWLPASAGTWLFIAVYAFPAFWLAIVKPVW